jgi:tRNA(Ile)-lysidine synthase
MRSPLVVGDVTIVRPFLAIGRDRLAATARAAGLAPVHDPMNADPRFDRVRMRRLLPTLAEEGLDPASIAATALRLADAADAIDAAATSLLQSAVQVDELAAAWLSPAAFLAAPVEVRQRALARLLMAIGGEDYSPRHERLAALLDAIAGAARFKRTLGGAVAERRGGRVVLYRETGREGLAEIELSPGDSLVWDHRFAVEVSRSAPAGLTIGPLGEAGRRVVGVPGSLHPAGAVAALPAVRRGETLIAVPPLARGEAGGAVTIRGIVAERLARPPLFPDLAGR